MTLQPHIKSDTAESDDVSVCRNPAYQHIQPANNKANIASFSNPTFQMQDVQGDNYNIYTSHNPTYQDIQDENEEPLYETEEPLYETMN